MTRYNDLRNLLLTGHILVWVWLRLSEHSRQLIVGWLTYHVRMPSRFGTNTLLIAYSGNVTGIVRWKSTPSNSLGRQSESKASPWTSRSRPLASREDSHTNGMGRPLIDLEGRRYTHEAKSWTDVHGVPTEVNPKSGIQVETSFWLRDSHHSMAI